MDNWNGAVWVILLSVLMFFGSIFVAWIVITRMPADYLTRDDPSEESFATQHPVIRAILLITRNVLGIALMFTGVVMLLTPGQGILCIFIGLTIADFPGKRNLIHRVVGRRGVLRLVNRIRERAHRLPLEDPHA